MDIKRILRAVDHTILSQTATWEQVKNVCDKGMEYKSASVCIPPSFVKRAKDYIGDRLTIYTVIGIPNGYSTTAVKVFETKEILCTE